jgi:hypothetical protein
MGKNCYERVDFTIGPNNEQIYDDNLKACPKCNTPRPGFATLCVLAQCGRGQPRGFVDAYEDWMETYE